MQVEIRFPRADNIGITTKIVEGVLVGVIKADILITPTEIGRLLNLQKQHTSLDLIIQAPQAQMDLDFSEIRPLEEESSAEGMAPVTFALFNHDYDTEGEEGELPFKVQIDHLMGAGRTPREAVVAALAQGGIIEPDAEFEEVVEYLRDAYPPEGELPRVLDVLINNEFQEHPFEDTSEAGPPPEASGTGKSSRGRKKAVAET